MISVGFQSETEPGFQSVDHVYVTLLSRGIVAAVYQPDAIGNYSVNVIVDGVFVGRSVDILDDFGRNCVILVNKGIPFFGTLHVRVAETAQRRKFRAIVRLAEMTYTRRRQETAVG